MANDLLLERIPQVRGGLLIGAFAGWNDAGDAASGAIEWFLQHGNPQRFAELDPEEFYDFTAARPEVTIDAQGLRALHWPACEWFELRTPFAPLPIVIFLGVEPQLRWHRFSNLFMDLAVQLELSAILLLGAYIQDIPHTRPTRLTGAASTAFWQERLSAASVLRSNYQGPTGILSVLQHAAQERSLPSLSIWGVVPHYISAHPNPRVSHALLRALCQVAHLTCDLKEMEEEAREFDRRVDRALQSSPEALEMLHNLEEQADKEEDKEQTENQLGPLPDSERLIEELERFLRSRQQNDSNDQ